MNYKKTITICLLLFLCQLSLFAQQKIIADSLANSRADSSQKVAENYIFQQREQQRIDSLVSVQLKTELSQVANDSKRRKSLEDSLHLLSKKDSVRKAEQMQNLAQLKQHAIGYPVALNKDTLFYIYTRLGSFSAAERAGL